MIDDDFEASVFKVLCRWNEMVHCCYWKQQFWVSKVDCSPIFYFVGCVHTFFWWPTQESPYTPIPTFVEALPAVGGGANFVRDIVDTFRTPRAQMVTSRPNKTKFLTHGEGRVRTWKLMLNLVVQLVECDCEGHPSHIFLPQGVESGHFCNALFSTLHKGKPCFGRVIDAPQLKVGLTWAMRCGCLENFKVFFASLESSPVRLLTGACSWHWRGVDYLLDGQTNSSN